MEKEKRKKELLKRRKEKSLCKKRKKKGSRRLRKKTRKAEEKAKTSRRQGAKRRFSEIGPKAPYHRIISVNIGISKILSNFLYIAFVQLHDCGLFYNHGYKWRHNFHTLQFTEMQYGSSYSL